MVAYGPTKGIPGAPGELNGVYEPALEVNVELGVQYGANGTEFTGSAQAGSDITVPPVTDVREGIIYGYLDSLTGVVHLPPENRVEYLYGYGSYGTELIGSAALNLTESGCFKLFLYESYELTIPLPADYSLETQELTFAQEDGTVVATVDDANLTKSATGTSFTIPPEVTAQVWDITWALRLTDDDRVIAYGMAHIYSLPGGT